MATLPGEWQIFNACIAYHSNDGRMDLVTINGDHAIATPWPPHYLEGDTQLHKSRRRKHETISNWEAFPRTLHTVPAVVAVGTSDNLFHMLFHAIPSREHFSRLNLPEAVHFLPRYVDHWPGYLRGGKASMVNTLPVSQWVGWELLMRSLLPDAAITSAMQTTQSLVLPERLQCYSSIVGGHGPFWPSVFNRTELFAAVGRVALFRQSVLANMGLLAKSASSRGLAHSHRIVFALRRVERCIVNMHEVITNVSKDESLAATVDFVDLSLLPLRKQIKRVASASGLVGVHGAALSFVVFLQARGTALLEIVPSAMMKTNSHSHLDYDRWAGMNDVRHFRLVQPDSPGCKGVYFRTCGNISADTNID